MREGAPMSLSEEALEIHKKYHGKIRVEASAPLKTQKDMALFYTPGVAEVCKAIAKDPETAYEYTFKRNTVGIITDGTRVLGLGNIGPLAGLPVMEGKAMIMKAFANIDAFPLCLKTKTADEFVETVERLEPVFGAINLEDIETPKVYDIEERLTKSMPIPIFHDDQHGTAIVTLAGLINALKVVGKDKKEVKVGIIGSGSAGYAITKLLSFYGFGNVITFDSKGALSRKRKDLDAYKSKLVDMTNPHDFHGTIDQLEGADILVAASKPFSIPEKTVHSMKQKNIVFALSNPTPEISLEDARKFGISVFGSGRSDYPNQINNSLCFPGFLRGLLDLRIRKLNQKMFVSAAEAIA